MTLWDDGPASVPISELQKDDKFIMCKYNIAADRGAMECGTARLTIERHDLHVIWHRKYRLFFILRQKAYPQLKDMDTGAVWTLYGKTGCKTILWSSGSRSIVTRRGLSLCHLCVCATSSFWQESCFSTEAQEARAGVKESLNALKAAVLLR